MEWLWILIGVWIAVSVPLAVVIGCAIKRADREERGSTLDWDSTQAERV